MSCCNPLTVPFFNVSQTVIEYSSSLRALYGDAPRISVYYQDNDLIYHAAGIMTQIKFDTFPVNTITVDHGGPAKGKIIIT